MSDEVTRAPPFYAANPGSTKTAVGSCPESRPAGFQRPYGNSVVCTEKLFDNSDLNCHMWAVNRPEGAIPQSDPQHMDPLPEEAATASAGSPGDFIRFVNELFY